MRKKNFFRIFSKKKKFLILDVGHEDFADVYSKQNEHQINNNNINTKKNVNSKKKSVTNSNGVLETTNNKSLNASQMNSSNGAVLNSDNHYERQYACKRCEFFTNNPRAVLYHRKEFHKEKINVHECAFCQYASQYSGKVERHTLLRHKIDVTSCMYTFFFQ